MGCVRVLVLTIATWAIVFGFGIAAAAIYRSVRGLDMAVVHRGLQVVLQFHMFVLGPILLIALALDYFGLSPFPGLCG